MEYRLYNCEDILVGESQNITDAKEYFGRLYDYAVDIFGKTYADLMTVKIFIDKGKAGKTKFAEYSIQDFLNKNLYISDSKPVMKVVEMEDPVKSEDSREFEERAKAFSDDEYRTVLKYVPTGFILGELMRRFDEYNKATDGIASLLDSMKIYNKE